MNTGNYERTLFHKEQIQAGIARMSPEAKKQHALNISTSFEGRVPRVFLDGLRELWNSYGRPGYRTFNQIAQAYGYPDKNYFYTIKLFRTKEIQ